MLRSLRFQLPALFLLGVVIAGLVSAGIALRLFRSYAQTRARDQDYVELAHEARGLTLLYGRQAGLRWWPVHSFFRPFWQCGSAAGRRKQSSS